jgi:hypothetical protein
MFMLAPVIRRGQRGLEGNFYEVCVHISVRFTSMFGVVLIWEDLERHPSRMQCPAPFCARAVRLGSVNSLGGKYLFELRKPSSSAMTGAVAKSSRLFAPRCAFAYLGNSRFMVFVSRLSVLLTQPLLAVLSSQQ